MATDFIGFVYAATVAAGGIMGYVKAGSLPSLGAGVAFGAILGVGAFLNSKPTPQPLVQLGTAVVLAGMMGARWSRSGKMMPAGMICLLSCAAAVRNVFVYNRYLPLPGREY